MARLFLFALLWWTVHGFTPPAKSCAHKSPLSATLAPNPPVIDEHSYVLTENQVHPLFRFRKGDKIKVINAFGLWTMFVSLVTGPFWMLAMMLMEKFMGWWDEAHNWEMFDKTGKIWSHAWLMLTDSFPSFSGEVDLLKEGHGPCLYVANHASWLDIPVLCTVLDPVFKFIAKGELKKVPCIGHQLIGGHHILIDREDRRSQLRTFKEGVAWLEKGVPLMAFPEGKRSKSGRLEEFKGGIFSMATRAKVPIVPISLAHTHAVMPSSALMPVQPGRGKLHVHVHPAIDSNDKTEAELAALVRESLLSAMPRDQQPLTEETEEEETPAAVAT